MTSLDTYLNLCTQVYNLSKPIPPLDAYEFYRSYAASAKGSILEPMCGTGRFLLPLVAQGFDVHGFDGSQHMLDVLQEKAKDQNLKVHVWQGLVEDLSLRKKYKLIFIPSGSFGLITDLQEAESALKKFYDILDHEGKLVFEVETLKAVPEELNVWKGDMYPRYDGKYILANFLDLTPQSNIGSTVCRYELIDKNTIVKTEIEVLKIRLYDPEELTKLLMGIGFTEIRMIKAFEGNKIPDKNDELIVFECGKIV